MLPANQRALGKRREIVSRFELPTNQNGPVFQEVILGVNVIQDALLYQKTPPAPMDYRCQCVKIIRKTASRGRVQKNWAFEQFVAIHQIEGL